MAWIAVLTPSPIASSSFYLPHPSSFQLYLWYHPHVSQRQRTWQTIFSTASTVIFQANFDASHWALGVIFLKERQFTLVDSCYNHKRNMLFKATTSTFLSLLCRALKMQTPGTL